MVKRPVDTCWLSGPPVRSSWWSSLVGRWTVVTGVVVTGVVAMGAGTGIGGTGSDRGGLTGVVVWPEDVALPLEPDPV